MSDIILKAIMVLAATTGLYFAVKEKKLIPTVITGGMSLGIYFVLFAPGKIQSAGFYIYMGFVVLAFIHGLLAKNSNILTKIVVSLMTASIFAYWLWALNHWHGNTLLLPILTLLTVLFAIVKKVKLKAELSFIVILVADAVVIIIEQCMKAN